MNRRPTILMIDDDNCYLGNMAIEFEKNADVVAFHPKELQNIEDFKVFEIADYALVDYDFGTHTSIDNKIAEFLRSKGFRGKMLLCSMHNDFFKDGKEIKKHYDGVIDKETLSWELLEKF